MYNTDLPNREDLPSTNQLLRSTAIAIAVAAALLITVILPAEYGIDPTRIGRLLGLTQMGEIKTQLATEAERGEPADSELETASVEVPAAVTLLYLNQRPQPFQSPSLSNKWPPSPGQTKSASPSSLEKPPRSNSSCRAERSHNMSGLFLTVISIPIFTATDCQVNRPVIDEAAQKPVIAGISPPSLMARTGGSGAIAAMQP